MRITTKDALAEIDLVLQRHGGGSFQSAYETVSLFTAAIHRLAPPGSSYLTDVQELKEQMSFEGKSPQAAVHTLGLLANGLEGVLKTLRADYEAGRLTAYAERVRADTFSDFLEIAEYLLDDEGLKDPAAVLAGGVLEEHLRKLCVKHGVVLSTKPKLDRMNADLADAGVYSKNDQKQVTAWAGIRNSAAHAQYTSYNADQVELMVKGIRLFLATYPA